MVLHQPSSRLNWLVLLLALSAKTDALSILQPQHQITSSCDVSCSNRKRRWQVRDRPLQHPCFGQCYLQNSRSGHPSTRLYNSPDEDEEIANSSNSTNPNNIPPKTADNRPNLLNMINPIKAGATLRSTVESAISAISPLPTRLPPERRALYYNFYLDDKLGLSSELKDSSPLPLSSSTSSAWYTSSDTDTRPEVLVVGATGALGRTLVKRLLLENKVRVRVLVRDLYSSTLNKLGTGVTYCTGDLHNMDSLEYAVTDLDKIVFCAGYTADGSNGADGISEEERLDGVRAVDVEGLQNLIHAYLNVRHADYGLSQSAKRGLFKFRSTSADFDLFRVDDGSIDIGEIAPKNQGDANGYNSQSQTKAGSSSSTTYQCSWKENKFHHGVFTGQVLGRYGEAALASVRLRSRNDPTEGLDLQSGGYAGLICRICSNGGVYEAFVRTEAYERLGVEYVCEFRTASKLPKGENESRDKFSTVRLDFSDFRARLRPDMREMVKQALSLNDIPRFVGKDVRQIGFRYRGANNSFTRSSSFSNSGWSRFYLSFDYIKLYRGQQEPEFVYLSDARIPPVLHDGMVRDDMHRLVSSSSKNIVDGSKNDRTAEEAYFKYKGEEIIKQSGLSYTIIRVAGYNELPGTDSSTVRLQKTNKDIAAVSRADLSQVIAGALLNPNACNLVLYMTKSQQRGIADGDIWQKFARLNTEQQEEELPFQ